MMSLAIYSEVERMIARGEQIKRNPRKKGNFGITGTKKAAPDAAKYQWGSRQKFYKTTVDLEENEGL